MYLRVSIVIAAKVLYVGDFVVALWDAGDGVLAREVVACSGISHEAFRYLASLRFRPLFLWKKATSYPCFRKAVSGLGRGEQVLARMSDAFCGAADSASDGGGRI